MKSVVGAGTGAMARRVVPVVAVVAAAVSFAACGVLRDDGPAKVDAAAAEQDVVSAAGWTRIATTKDYLLVVNVLPGEHMFTAEEMQRDHPVEGEQIIKGPGNSLGPNVRHVEAHVYDRTTGLPLSNVTTSIVVVNRTTGVKITVTPTLMQDVNIGALDIHYGNNIEIPGDSDLSLSITVNGQGVTVDGHLD